MFFAALAILLVQLPSLPRAEAEERLILAAISDFKAHQLRGSPRSFRSVHAAALKHPDGVERPLLCGEVRVERRDGSSEWMMFATLETDGYEQFLGLSAGTWCNDGTKRDLSHDLSSRLVTDVVQQK